MITLGIQLILAHIIGDFVLQPTKWVKDKQVKKHKSKYLYFHIIIHALAVFTVLQFNFEFWFGMLVILVSHFIIDLIKLHSQTEKNKRQLFLIDQIAHLLVIVFVVYFYNKDNFNVENIFNSKTLLFIVTILLVTKVVSIVIDVMISKWQIVTEDKADSLEDAGSYIGMLERLLILFFIVLDHWEGVGFLLAAKSVFRFGDLTNAKDRKLTEYILIGTLLSFGFAILFSQAYVFFRSYME